MTSPACDKASFIEEELLLVTNSGEIPEVAFHGSLYFLTQDPAGPRLVLTAEDIAPLKQAVFDRYCKIMRRDLNPLLRDKRIYRGLARCCCNWRRFDSFCRKEAMDPGAIRAELADLLLALIQRELADLAAGLRPASSVNCSTKDLCQLAEALDLPAERLPEGWQSLCPALI